jgi:hypothetical protein
MDMQPEKSANQRWKQELASGMTYGDTKADFKIWLQRKKAMSWSNVTGPALPTSSLQEAIDQLHQAGGQQVAANADYLFGISKKTLTWTAVGIGVMVTGFIIYKLVKR